jgi:hypothetical protein
LPSHPSTGHGGSLSTPPALLLLLLLLLLLTLPSLNRARGVRFRHPGPRPAHHWDTPGFAFDISDDPDTCSPGCSLHDVPFPWATTRPPRTSTATSRPV